jgi:apolipoprotein N-acyltransferase
MNVTTPYERVGDLFAWLCVLATGGALLGRRRPG